VAPRFPPPEHLLPRSRHGDQSVSSQNLSEISAVEKISRFCGDLRRVQELMRTESDQRDLWNDTIFPGLHISPILGDLLAIRVDLHDEADIATKSLEAFRLAAILYICSLRAKFGIEVLSIAPRYAAKMRALFLSSEVFVREAEPTLLNWCLAVGCTSHCLPDQRAWFSEVLGSVMVAKGVTNFPDLMATLTQVFWYEDLLMTETESLNGLFQAG
jgi:hypothetical protein